MSAPRRVTVSACANIAFIKYWGNRPEGGNLPLNPSISMTMRDCVTRTQAELTDADQDEMLLGGFAPSPKARARVSQFLDALRAMAGRREKMRLTSGNSFPTGCGIASSASAFAALAVVAARLYDLPADARELSRLARLGSGSAARSVMGGFVELHPAGTHADAFAEQLASETAWPELRDVVVILSDQEKAVSSADGHRLADTSEMLPGRLGAVPERAQRVREAIARRDLARLGEAAEEDAVSMHAVMMTSRPPLLYWSGATLEVIHAVWEMRRRGTQVYFTIDAGPNVHLLTLERHLLDVQRALIERFNPRMVVAAPGPGPVVEEGAE